MPPAVQRTAQVQRTQGAEHHRSASTVAQTTSPVQEVVQAAGHSSSEPRSYGHGPAIRAQRFPVLLPLGISYRTGRSRAKLPCLQSLRERRQRQVGLRELCCIFGHLKPSQPTPGRRWITEAQADHLLSPTNNELDGKARDQSLAIVNIH